MGDGRRRGFEEEEEEYETLIVEALINIYPWAISGHFILLFSLHSWAEIKVTSDVHLVLFRPTITLYLYFLYNFLLNVIYR